MAMNSKMLNKMSFKINMLTHNLVITLDMTVKLSSSFREDDIRLITVRLRSIIGKFKKKN